jgi:importin subunit alpha-1
VPSLLWLVDYPSSKVRNEALWSLSNIAAGSHSQIQSLIDAGVVPRIMPFMKDWASESKEEKDRFKETVWTLGNMLKSGSNSQRRYLLNEKVFEAFCPPLRNLTALGEKSQQVVLEGLYRLLCFAQADFVGSKEVISSLFKKEKLRDLLTASKFSIHHQYSRFWMSEVCNLVRKLKLE